MTYTLINNTNKQQYEYQIQGETAKVEYEKAGDILILTHTEVPPDIQGNGIGHDLVKNTLDDIAAHHQKIVPLCPFIVRFIEDNPQYAQLAIEL